MKLWNLVASQCPVLVRVGGAGILTQYSSEWDAPWPDCRRPCRSPSTLTMCRPPCAYRLCSPAHGGLQRDTCSLWLCKTHNKRNYLISLMETNYVFLLGCTHFTYTLRNEGTHQMEDGPPQGEKNCDQLKRVKRYFYFLNNMYLPMFKFFT